jgi:hypothetical protein
VSQMPCDIPLLHVDGDDSSSVMAPKLVSSTISASLGGSSLQDNQTRSENFGTRTLGQLEVFEASLFKLRLDKEPWNDI